MPLRSTLLLAALSCLLLSSCAAQTLPVRPPAVSGRWYEASPPALRAGVAALLEQGKGKCALKPGTRPAVLVVPHAGYVYSGPVAAAAYAALKGGSWERVILLGPAHYAPVRGAAIPAVSGFATPLGVVPLDREACDGLTAQLPFHVDTSAHEKEHCLECQLPFLQVLLPGVKIVPVLVGQASGADLDRLAEALDKLLDDRTLLVVSTDFTHYGASFGFTPFASDIPGNLRQWNLGCAEAILKLDRPRFEKHLRETRDTICGALPVLVAMRILSGREKSRNVAGSLAAYDTSGAQGGDWSLSVSYLALVFAQSAGKGGGAAVPDKKGGEAMEPETKPLLTTDEHKTLLALARKTLEVRLSTGKPPADPGEGFAVTEALRRPWGVFVTLEKGGRLRGCIGTVVPVPGRPLYRAVSMMAISAALEDPRFPPLNAGELKDLEIEISILSPIEPCLDYTRVVVGRHGLIIRQGGQVGLLLPQVPVEWHWDRTEFLEQVCHKAGLPAQAYRAPDAELFTFTAEVFNEKKW